MEFQRKKDSGWFDLLGLISRSDNWHRNSVGWALAQYADVGSNPSECHIFYCYTGEALDDWG